MGKVVKYTGSKLLGSELRRLRGGRSLAQIAELSRLPPLADRVSPIAPPTLSQIENGISFPSLETLHSLALLYKRPVQQLLDLVVQERLLESTEPPQSLEEAAAQFSQQMASGAYGEALATAVWAEREAEGSQEVRWRANRALALSKVGMLHDAIDWMRECLEDERAPLEQRYQLHQAMADMLALSGALDSASLHSQEALRLAPASLDPRHRRPLLRGRAMLIISKNERLAQPDARAAREAGQLLRQALEATDATDHPQRLLIESHRAWCTAHEGNLLVAIKELEACTQDARQSGEGRALRESLLALGLAQARARRTKRAVASLEEAGALAADADETDFAFGVYLKLHELVAASDPDRATHYLRRCERFYPFVTGRGPGVREFERLTRLTR